jgi:hypothetical protein
VASEIHTELINRKWYQSIASTKAADCFALTQSDLGHAAVVREACQPRRSVGDRLTGGRLDLAGAQRRRATPPLRLILGRVLLLGGD